MNNFAFIVSFSSLKQLKKYFPALRLLPDFAARLAIKKLPFFHILHFKKIQSLRNVTVEGHIIFCPVLPEEGERPILDKIISAGRIAKRCGAKIIGLNSCASIIAGRNYRELTRILNLPLTNGNTFTAWSTIETVYRASRIKKLNLKESCLTVIGAANPIGSLCARKLSYYTNRIILVGSQKERLEYLKEAILRLNPIEVTIEEQADRALKDADIIINVDNASEIDLGLDLTALKPNSIFCSIFRPQNPGTSGNNGVFMLKSGLVKMPFPDRVLAHKDFPKGVICAALAETMLLAFAGKFTDYSFEGNINLDKLEEIADIAARHGFEIWAPEVPVI